ncbi:hypothetical protein SGCZBJ_12700 [Caulobacter zeae]|uniref:Uncharacterized protein n=1 Tax=Caulobacter zeae TaxID=2055137 RepID=A0A2N5DG99_9CAUL|nr:hypothetical protein [Caulobacter zeae]PLR25088.1 hypothetical protein SGCZBJ_12700 [Caulobacter zeae]
MTDNASLKTLPLADAVRQVSAWLEDCEDLLGLKPDRDLPRPPFRLDEAWVVVRLAADQLAVPTKGEIPHQLVGIAQHLETERGPDFPARRAVLLEAARQLSAGQDPQRALR